MPSNAFTSAGTRIRVTATAPATYDDLGFEALSDWDTIGEVTDLGEFGREYSLVTHNPLATRRTVKRKGSFNDGQVNMQLALDDNDAGQSVLELAVDDDDGYFFEVELQNGKKLYFEAVVMSFTTNVGSVDQITSGAVMLEITNDIIAVSPTSI
jgi:hypothetical protein